MDKKQMYKWLELKDKDNLQIFMPNEIFEDLNKVEFKQWKHNGFAYAYYYLSSYIYRMTLYGHNPLLYTQDIIIKTLTSNVARVSYVTKKNGLLEQLNYIKTTSHYPVYVLHFELDDESTVVDFQLINKEIKQDSETHKSVPNNYTIKEPNKALKRYEDDDDYSGTYYDISNTHFISVERFISILTDNDLGTTGVYLYAYLSMNCDKYKNNYVATNKALMDFLGCSENTITKYTKRLEELKFIRSSRETKGSKMFEKTYSIIGGKSWLKK